MDENKKDPSDRQTEIKDAYGEVELSNAMKVLEGTGQANVNEHESKFGGKKIGKAENFWYRHKWHAGLIIFAIIAGVVILWQLLTNVTPDAYVVYCGPQAFVGKQYDAFNAAITDCMGDYNGDGKRKISLADNTYLNEAQIKELQARDSDYLPDYSSNSLALMRYRTEITAGKHMFCMLDPELYTELRDADGFLPLSEIFGEVLPEEAEDDYGIRLGDTEFYKYYKDIQFIPADTVLAVRNAAVLDFKSEEKKEEYQESYKKLLKDIVSFTPPEQ